MGLPLHKPTLAEFLAWESDQADRHEFYRGDVFAMVGGTARHNRVIMNLGSRIADHLDGTGCQVFAESMKVQIAEGVLYPDLVVTCGKPDAGDEQVLADPTLIVEVLSPSTRGYDKRDKFTLYRSITSMREYALIDPSTRQVEVFTLAEAGAWLFTDQTGAGALTLRTVDLVLPFDQVFKGVAALDAQERVA